MDVNDFIFEDDILIENGDFKLEESNATHIENILKANKGFFFQDLLIGQSIEREIKSPTKTKQELKQDIRRQLVYDNYNVDMVDFTETAEVNITAKRIK